MVCFAGASEGGDGLNRVTAGMISDHSLNSRVTDSVSLMWACKAGTAQALWPSSVGWLLVNTRVVCFAGVLKEGDGLNRPRAGMISGHI